MAATRETAEQGRGPHVRLHIFGASGSGTTTLGGLLAARLGLARFDADDFFWERTEPPFTTIVPAPLRQERLKTALAGHSAWVLSGSLTGWGDFLIPEFDLVIFLALPRELRMERLMSRELRRYGDRIREGGELHEHHRVFLAWAGSYDTGGMETRSRASHEAWLAALPGRVLRLEGDLEPGEKVSRVLGALAACGAQGQA